MKYLLCRNRVEDYGQWRVVFDQHVEAYQAAGLSLERIWSTEKEPNNIWFLFTVENVKRAIEFMNDPAAIEAGRVSGVLDGEVVFLDELPGVSQA